MTDDDVVQLLHRAVALAPAELDREPVAAVARRRSRRRWVTGGVGVTAVLALVAVVAPGVGPERQVLVPAVRQDVSTEFFDLRLPVNTPGGGDWVDCLELPGAGLVAGPATMSPSATVSAVGTDEERRTVERCLRAAAAVAPASAADLRAVQVGLTADGDGPLRVSVGDSYPEQLTAFRAHDVTVQNTSAVPVHVDDPTFGQVLPTGLFVGIGCRPSERAGEVVPYCVSRYSPFTLAPGEVRTLSVRLASGQAQGAPLPLGRHATELSLGYRSTEPFRRPGDTTGASALRVTLDYDVTGPRD